MDWAVERRTSGGRNPWSDLIGNGSILIIDCIIIGNTSWPMNSTGLLPPTTGTLRVDKAVKEVGWPSCLVRRGTHLQA